MKSITKMPIMAKGVVTAEDARLAVQYGCAGIIVSNHGARQLDGVVSTIDALEEVVQAVQGRVPVVVDSGVRRGTDIVKALALGAKAVMVSRNWDYSLTVAAAVRGFVRSSGHGANRQFLHSNASGSPLVSAETCR